MSILQKPILILLLILLPIILKGQKHNLLQTSIEINLENKTLKEVIQFLELNYNLNFSYSDNILPSQPISEIKFASESLQTALIELLSPYSIDFKLVNNQIVLYPAKTNPVNFSISGFISDKSTGENLIGVSIFCQELNIGTISNEYGFYSLNIPKGDYEFTFSYLGYESRIELIDIQNNQHRNINLEPTKIIVDEVKITKSVTKTHTEYMQLNTSALGMKELSLISGLFGENDVARNIGLLPGIRTNEFSSGNVYVRGGGSDQTLFLMDEAKMYNASHFGGIFSVFNPDIVNDVKVFKGDLPVSDGGAISSLINVHLKEGNNQQWQYKGSIGLLSAKALIEGPVKKDKSSVLIAFRRSYIDALLGLMRKNLQPAYANYYFYDLNVKYNNKLNSKNRIFFSAYSGTDYLKLASDIQRTNQMVNLRWNHVYNSKLFSNTSIIFSRNKMVQTSAETSITVNWERYINNLLLKTDFSYFPFSQARFNFGFSSNTTEINPYIIKSFDENSFLSQVKGPIEYLYTNSLYFSGDIAVTKKMRVNAGIRCSYIFNPRAWLHNSAGNSFESFSDTSGNRFLTLTFEPRLYVNIIVFPNISFKAGYNRQTNPLHQLEVSDLGITINRWMPASKGYLPQVSDNFSAGLYFNKFKWLKTEIECYYRKMDNLLETLHNQKILTSYSPDKYLYSAYGIAKGIEVSATMNYKQFYSIVNYTFSNAQWKTAGINENRFYPASHDRLHNFNIVASFKTRKRLSVSAVWTYASGSPYTPVAGKYVIDGKVMTYYSNTNINASRLPDYHRLDLSMDIAGKKNNKRSWKSFWNFSVYNAYFHKNPYSLIYFSPVTDNNLNTTIELKPTFLYFYQFVPSVTYRFEF